MKRKLTSEVDREMVISQIKRLDLKKNYTVDITQKNPHRTISQNALYWLWLTCISFETGNDKDDLHDILKKKYLEPKEVKMFGENHLIWTTTDNDTVKFKNYLDKIQIFASQEGIILPDPETKYWDEFYSYYVDKL
jgi:hypothetical protein